MRTKHERPFDSSLRSLLPNEFFTNLSEVLGACGFFFTLSVIASEETVHDMNDVTEIQTFFLLGIATRKIFHQQNVSI